MTFTEALNHAFVRQSCLPRTCQCYRGWIRSFYRFVQRPAKEWTGADVQNWLTALHRQNYSNVSRKQALCAVAFAFKHVLQADMGKLDLPPYPIQHKTLRTIPSREELGRVFAGLRGQVRLMAGIMYGAGLRVSECCTLRVQDLDFGAATIRVHNGKGDRSRLTLLPVLLAPALQRQVAWRKALHDQDLAAGAGHVPLPGRLAIKYKGAAREFRWHTTDEAVSKQMRKAVNEAGLIKRVTPHTLRHAFATHAMRGGNDIETVRELLGHESLETTMIYLHADAAQGVSPLDVSRANDGRFASARGEMIMEHLED
jgi:site-specific recombinase XerD